MKIIEYQDKYKEEIKSLLVELQAYIVKIDDYHYNILTEDFKEKYFSKTIDEIKKYNGKILVAVDNNIVVGLIIGIINNDEISTYDFKAPKRGRITELIVSKKSRSKGVGKLLLTEMEKYLKSIGCHDVILGVFGTNENAKNFYYKNGYEDRYIEVTKKL